MKNGVIMLKMKKWEKTILKLHFSFFPPNIKNHTFLRRGRTERGGYFVKHAPLNKTPLHSELFRYLPRVSILI